MIQAIRNRATGRVGVSWEGDDMDRFVVEPGNHMVSLDVPSEVLERYYTDGDGAMYLMERPESKIPVPEVQVRDTEIDGWYVKVALPLEEEPEASLDEVIETLQSTTSRPDAPITIQTIVDAQEQVKEGKRARRDESHSHRKISGGRKNRGS